MGRQSCTFGRSPTAAPSRKAYVRKLGRHIHLKAYRRAVGHFVRVRSERAAQTTLAEAYRCRSLRSAEPDKS